MQTGKGSFSKPEGELFYLTGNFCQIKKARRQDRTAADRNDGAKAIQPRGRSLRQAFFSISGLKRINYFVPCFCISLVIKGIKKEHVKQPHKWVCLSRCRGNKNPK